MGLILSCVQLQGAAEHHEQVVRRRPRPQVGKTNTFLASNVLILLQTGYGGESSAAGAARNSATGKGKGGGVGKKKVVLDDEGFERVTPVSPSCFLLSIDRARITRIYLIASNPKTRHCHHNVFAPQSVVD